MKMKEFESVGGSESYRRFAKDKRVRQQAAEPATRPAHGQHAGEQKTDRAPRRRSFNPNFTADNKLQEGNSRRTKPSGKFAETNSSPARKPAKAAAAAGKRKASHPSKFAKKGMGAGESMRGEYPKYPAPKQNGAMRLNRYVAMSGLCSRREADDYIRAGVVSVNGKVVTELGTKVLPSDEVKFNDQRISSEKKVYILMNKPKGFVTSIEDPHADRLVMDIVRNACSERVYPVGRLDKNSVGVLLITNDGDLTKQLTHPSYNKRKVYEVALDKPLSQADAQAIVDGISLEDGDIAADDLAFSDKTKKVVGIEIHSGRNRIVRRIFEHFGYNVTRLDRVYFAGLTKKNLKRGQWRFLTDAEVRMLKSGRYE